MTRDSLDIYLKLQFQGDQLPGYGWVFPMGNGIFNIGLGYVNSYKNWQSINATQFLGEFLRTLPRDWDLPAIEELREQEYAPGACRWASPRGGRSDRVCCSPRLSGRRQAGFRRGISKALGVRPGRRRVRDCRSARTADPTTSPTTRSAWRRRGAGVQAGPLHAQADRTAKLANAGIKLIDNAAFRDRMLKRCTEKADVPLHTTH